MVEHLTFNQMVEGSIPSPLTNKFNGLCVFLGAEPGVRVRYGARDCTCCVHGSANWPVETRSVWIAATGE